MSPRAASLAITPEFLSLIAEPGGCKGAWSALWALPPGRLAALHRVTIASPESLNRNEDSRPSYSEVASPLNDVEVKKFATNIELVGTGHANVITSICSRADAIDLTGNHIRLRRSDLLA